MERVIFLKTKTKPIKLKNMITTPKMYGVQCDNCGTHHESNQGFSCMSDDNYLRDDAIELGWHNKGDKDYCTGCHHIDDRNNLIIHKKPIKL